MSHEVETMAYAGQVPWHGLGVKVAQCLPGAEMLQAAGLNWKAEKVPAGVLGADGAFLPVTDAYFIGRDSDRRILSKRTLSGEFSLLQNADLFDAFGGEVRWETAGSLRNGCRVWGLAPTEIGGFEARKGDKVLPYLLAFNSHDGSSCLRVRFTSVRVVCANTASMALGEKDEAAHEVSIRHSGDMAAKLEECARVMRLAQASFDQQAEVARALANAPMTKADALGFFAQLLTGEANEIEAARKFRDAEGRSATILANAAGQLAQLFAAGKGNVGETRWDAFNAVTEFIDHQRGRLSNWKRAVSKLDATGLDSAWFGDGAKRKATALRLLVNR
jgi:phage/plasmid-like protein (TIGR03299 family)